MSPGAGTGETGHLPVAAPNNLPVLRSPLVGRETELAAASTLLMSDEVGLLTLTGPGGVGKTSLALQLAADLLERFPQGVFFVNLAPLTDPTLVVSTIAQTLGVKENPDKPLVAELQDYLRNKETLLVLDNFEQVVEAASTVAALLAACPRLKILATSREVLRLSAEHTFPVPPLACPSPQQQPSFEQLKRYEAVRLFMQRAAASKPDFRLTGDNAPAVAAICVRLDGLPLAIELAAARIRLLSPEAILARLEHRLVLLTGGARDFPARHQTLRSTIEWSYDLLDDSEKKLFSRLAVFVGGRTLEAVEKVCNAEGDLGIDVLEGISSLVDKSLLRKEDGSGHEPRFVMLETIHEYAREKLQESGEKEEVSRRHALYFMALVEEAEPGLRGGKQVAWLDRLEEEHDNLRAALAWSYSEADHDDNDDSRLEIGLRIAGALLGFWDTRGHFTEGRAHLARLLSRSESSGPTSVKARALLAAGMLAWAQGDLEEAYSLYEESLAIYRSLEDKLGITYALNGLANTVKLYGDYAAAASFLEQSLVVSRQLGDKERIAAALENLGEIALAQGEYDRAWEIQEEALSLFRDCGDKRGSGFSLQDLGIIALRQGRYEVALSLFEEALALYHEIGEKRFSVVVQYELGQVARGQGDNSRAENLFKESLSAAQNLRDRIFAGLSLEGLAASASAEGKALRAARLFGAADAIMGATGYRWFQADRATFDQARAAAHETLGDERWEAAVQEGQRLSMDDAVAYALEPEPEPPQAFPAESGAAPILQQLTRREVEILRLVAEGLTTPEMAERLYLSARTVENHLRSIYGKLNVSTRAAATRIAVEQGLHKD